MKCILTLFVLVLLTDHSQGQSPRPIRVLIVTGMDIDAHDWPRTTEAIKEELEKDARMQVQVLENPYRLDSVDLSAYQVVYLNFNNYQKPDPGEKAEKNLKRFVLRGGGLVVMHFASGAFGNWDEFQKLAGKVWDKKNTHDPRGPFQVEITDSTHPVTRNVGSYNTDDELYICLTGTQPVTLLARAMSKTTGTYQPMAFVLRYGKGRIFHTTLGHDARAVHIPGTAALLRNGVAWVAKRSDN